MKTGRPKLKLAVEPSVREQMRRLRRETRDARTKERLQALLLAIGGRHTYEEIAEAVGRSKGTIQLWVGRFLDGGLERLLQDRRREGRPTPINEDIRKALAAGLKKGQWRSGEEVRRWLHQTHGVQRSLSCVYWWLGKLGGALKVPRPVHIQKNAEATAAFKVHLTERLQALNLPAQRRVRIWVQDESRYGLHSLHRRCWGLRGVRVTKPTQQKYQWGYLYGALDVLNGGGQFCFLPTVSLELTEIFLQQIAHSDPQAEHVVIWDQAGFHHRPDDNRLPERIHLLPLPPYSPELNPIEKLWDVLKDAVCNRVFDTLERIEWALCEALEPFWRSPHPARNLVGTGWLYSSANASPTDFILINC